MTAYFTFDWPDYLIFAFWLVIYSIVGIYHRYRGQIRSRLCPKKVNNSNELNTADAGDAEDLLLGGRSLRLLPVLSSVMASFLSAVSLMGTASEAYVFGIQFMVMIVAYCIAFSLTAELYMPVFYKLRLTSAHEYLEMRFSKSVRWVTSIIFCLQMWVYISLALYAPALALEQVTGLPIWLSLVTTGLVSTFYTSLGGLRAVVWTDVFQLFVLTIGLLLVVIIGIMKVGGAHRVWEVALEGRRLQSFDFSFDPFIRHSFWTLSIGGSGMVLSIFATNQTQIQRYLACRDMQTARRAILLNIPLNSIFLLVQLASGLVAYTYFSTCDPVTAKVVGQYDQILPFIVMVLFDGIAVVRGLFLSIIFAAVLSTVSSGINSLATVALEDIIRPLHLFVKKRDVQPKAASFIAILLSVFFGLTTIGLAYMFTLMSPRILQFAFSLFGAIGGPILAVFTLGILVPCVNWKGGLAGLVASTIVGLVLTVMGMIYPSISTKLPLVITNCSMLNITSNPMPPIAESLGAVSTIKSISYLYYSPICLIVALVVGLSISACTGFNTRTPVPSYLLAWQARRCYRHLPECIPSQWKYSKKFGEKGFGDDNDTGDHYNNGRIPTVEVMF